MEETTKTDEKGMNEDNLNEDIRFCETCRYRAKDGRADVRCCITMKSLRFYDRACDHYSPVTENMEYEWDNYLKMYVLR